MKCHYEVLNISREADDSEIKAAYRKLALKWHPDKNLDSSELAKEQFQLVQQAYEILSDRQERAWYDKHREQILRGSNSDYKDNNLDVFQYFTTTSFKGYGDDEKGFYCVYGKVFEQIGQEDLEYMEAKDKMYDIPKFGNSQDDYDEVVKPFYDYWMSYSTKKSYVWLDPHDIKEALNRKVFKLIEKENDKIRQKAKKERNEEVRSLVAFVRKRDKRVQNHIKDMETKKIENREKQKTISKQKRMERITQLNESSEQADWMKFENVKTELEEIEKKLAEQFGDQISDSDDNFDPDEVTNLYCVACNKIFKTPKAFKNHESSKKHRENIEHLKQTLAEDNLLIEEESVNGSEDINAAEIENNFNDSLDLNSGEDFQLEDEEDQVNIINRKKKNKKAKNVIKILEHNSDLENNDILDNNTENVEFTSTKKKKTKKKREKQIQNHYDKELKNDEIKSNDKYDEKDNEERKQSEDICCMKCKAEFPSKNKLFEHLKKTGHSCYNGSNVEKPRKKNVKQK